MDKHNLRNKYKQIRAELVYKPEQNAQILQHVLQLPAYRQAKLLLTYVSFGDEVDTHELIRQSIARGKRVAVPKCEGREITFYLIHNFGDLQEGAYGILEPQTSEEVTDFEDSVCIIPGIAFDRENNRIGYGAGYYDRFLMNYKGTKIGLTYSACICESIDSDLHDIKMDKVVHNNLHNSTEVCYGEKGTV